jgi:hypothetical protein
VILLVGGYAGAYAIFAILTRDAPPPPSFALKPKAGFAVALDGRWYTGDCQSIEILGGWILPSRAEVTLAGRSIRISEPVDLTGFKGPGASRQITAIVSGASQRLEIRWAERSVLVILGSDKGRLAFTHTRSGAC